MSQCPDQHDAKRLFKEHSATLSLVLTNHAEERLLQHDMALTDCMNVLRGGVWDPPEWENGSWRYRARTQKMTVIVEIDSENLEFTIITCWRNS